MGIGMRGVIRSALGKEECFDSRPFHTFVRFRDDERGNGVDWWCDYCGALGLYSRAYNIFRLPLVQVAAPMTKVALPVLSRLQHDTRYEAYVQRAQVVLAYTFGGLFAKPIFAVLAIGGVFQAIGFVYYWVFLSKALTGLQLRWTLIGRAVMVAAIAAGVAWGPIGVAIGSSIGQVLLWLMTTLFPMAATGVNRRQLLLSAAKPVLLFTPVAVACYLLSQTVWADWSAWLQLPALALLFAAYLTAAALIPAIRGDYRAVWSTAKHLRQK